MHPDDFFDGLADGVLYGGNSDSDHVGCLTGAPGADVSNVKLGSGDLQPTLVRDGSWRPPGSWRRYRLLLRKRIQTTTSTTFDDCPMMTPVLIVLGVSPEPWG